MVQIFTDIQEWSNFVFLWIFTVEAVLKIMGLGFKKYFFDKMNLMDFLIVVRPAAYNLQPYSPMPTNPAA